MLPVCLLLIVSAQRISYVSYLNPLVAARFELEACAAVFIFIWETTGKTAEWQQ